MDEYAEGFQELLELIHLETLEADLFRGESRDIGTQRVFGGQVLCQALLAASATVEDRLAHSLHAYFLRAGDPAAPIVYSVDRSRDGRSFSARRVVAIQHGRPIFTLAASFQVFEEGLEHQFDMPDVPPPDRIGPGKPVDPSALEHLPQKMRRWIDRFGPFEFRRVGDYDPFHPEPQEPRQQVWFRLHGELPDDPVLHRALLAYVSDFHLVGTGTLAHGLSWAQGDLVMASLDHAMWFHASCRLNDWMLYDCDSPSTGGGRGLSRGMLFSRDGRLVASTAQEGVIRLRKNRDNT
ncbi:acyl-CoA thioesterase [Elongatibacter sediminis]|uniref:Acyl-CoA thioesterase 2 n=1 Tax=Elongatibacter sediminis TaxID=3119006 RepID=A0AAW9RC44_9GAMM